MKTNLSIQVNDGVDDIKFLVLNQDETYYVPLIGTTSSNNGFAALVVLTFLLSLPGNIAILAAVFRNGLKNRPVNLVILVTP